MRTEEGENSWPGARGQEEAGKRGSNGKMGTSPPIGENGEIRRTRQKWRNNGEMANLAGNVFLRNVFGGEEKDTRQGHVADMSPTCR